MPTLMQQLLNNADAWTDGALKRAVENVGGVVHTGCTGLAVEVDMPHSGGITRVRASMDGVPVYDSDTDIVYAALTAGPLMDWGNWTFYKDAPPEGAA